MSRKSKEIKLLLSSEHDKLFALLLKQGCSPEEAMRTLDTIFDWQLRGALRPVLRNREDKYADTEKKRMTEAEKGEDFCQVWLALKLGGASEESLEHFTIECRELDYFSMCLWILGHGLQESFDFGLSVLAVESSEEPECR